MYKLIMYEQVHFSYVFLCEYVIFVEDRIRLSENYILFSIVYASMIWKFD